MPSSNPAEPESGGLRRPPPPAKPDGASPLNAHIRSLATSPEEAK